MKIIRKALSLLLALTLVFSLVNFTAAASSSAPTVVYDVKAEEFRFENVEVYEHTEEGTHEHPQNVDLFRDMKNVFPGDVYTQHIQLKVENVGYNKVNLYLRAENPNEDFETLMAAGSEAAPVLWVQYDDVAYNSTLDGGVKLGQFSRRMEENEIDVTLEIPLEAGNELQALIAEIDWVFTAEVIPYNNGGGDEDPEEEPEEIPDDPTPGVDIDVPTTDIPEPPIPTTPPKTGDASMLWLVLAALSGAGLILLMMTGKKKEETEA